MVGACESRTTIDLATGIIMEQIRCSQDEAFTLLRNASQSRNQKLHDVANDILNNRPGSHSKATITHFDHNPDPSHPY
jgi:AmiR/NasT family two-component response regulator